MTRHRLSGRHAVVTGAAGDIGMAVCRRLAREGASVSLWDLGTDRVREAIAEIAALGSAAHGEACDITDPAAVAAALAASRAALGPVDILVNNAGILQPGNFLDREAHEWHRTVEVNLNAVITVTRAVLPEMYERNHGHIVNISSASGVLGVPGISVYAATKWAVWGLTESLRGEAINAGKKGVRYSSVHPSYVRSGLFAGARLRGLGAVLVPRLKNHDVVARAVVHAAIIRRQFSPKRPRSVRIAVLLRGILPDRWFQAFLRAIQVHRSMSSWTGSGGRQSISGKRQG